MCIIWKFGPIRQTIVRRGPVYDVGINVFFFFIGESDEWWKLKCENVNAFQKHTLYISGKMGCNCSSDYSDGEWIENLDEICEHCNCPIAPQSCNPVSVCRRLFSIHSVRASAGKEKRSRSLKWTWELKYLCRPYLKVWASSIIFSHQYTDQLIGFHSSQFSPPSSPLPGNYIAFVCDWSEIPWCSAGCADILYTHIIDFLLFLSE